MEEKKNIPEIRFKGFVGEWEESKLLNVVKRITRKNTNLESTLPLTISAQYGLVDQITYFNNRVASRDVSNYYLLNQGEFAYNKSYSEGFPFGAVKRLDRYDQGVLSTLYIIFSINTNFLDSDFLVSYYDSDFWHKQVSERAAEGARNHGLLNISADSFFDTTLKYSKDKEEQSQIGTFFQNLDKQITLEQQKHDKLITLKKAMLEKMFPKEGASVPEIRFEGFEDAWEERKIGELGDIVTGSTPSTQESLFYSNNGIPWVTPTDITENITHSTAKYLSIKGMQVSRLVPKNTILVTCIASIGKNTILGTLGSFNQQINGLISDENNYNAYFLFTESALWSNEMKRSASSGTMQIVNKTEFKELKTFIPSIEEQSQIGTYFQNLDKLISLQKQKINKLKNIKKACLDKMFV